MRVIVSALLFMLSLSASTYVCDLDRDNHEYMASWCASPDAERLRKEYAVAKTDPVFATFLTAFVQHEEVAKVLAARPYFDYAGKVIEKPLPDIIEGAEDAHAQERAERKKAKDEYVAVYNTWLELFLAVLAKFSAKIMKNPHHECPSALVIRFDAFPQYVVKMRARNGYRLGFYDEHGRLSCAVPGTRISEFEFPAQLVARLLYAEKIKKFLAAHEITNVQVPNKYLFVFPGYEDRPLNDEHLFVVADFVPFEFESQDALLEGVCFAYMTYKEDEAKDSADELVQLLVKLFKVVEGCSLWDFSEGAGNFVFTFNDAGQPSIVLLDTERPAFGGSNPQYFFHKNVEECESNASVGKKMLEALFTKKKEKPSDSSKDR